MSAHHIVGWGVGICSLIVLVNFLPDVTCVDGWKSLSIGRRGACSHHGGVKGNGFYLMLIVLISGGLGFGSSILIKNHGKEVLFVVSVIMLLAISALIDKAIT